MNRSESIANLAKALSGFQGELEAPKKTSDNPYFKSKYADLAAVLHSAKLLLIKYELAVVQATDVIDGKLYLLTTLMHSSGEWITAVYPVRPRPTKDKDTGQIIADTPVAMGSALTYARRYSVMAMLGIASEDDDGAAVSETFAPPAPTSLENGGVRPAVRAPVAEPHPAAAQTVMKFGKHKGKKWSEVPAEYLRWWSQQPDSQIKSPQLFSYAMDVLEELDMQGGEEKSTDEEPPPIPARADFSDDDIPF